MNGTRPYDCRWGSAKEVWSEFHIGKDDLKNIYLDGHVKGRQVSWKDDDHRCQVVYCFEDIHRWLEDLAHRPSEGYVEKFWKAKKGDDK